MYSMYQFGQAVLQGLGGYVQPVQARPLNSVESRAIQASPLPTRTSSASPHTALSECLLQAWSFRCEFRRETVCVASKCALLCISGHELATCGGWGLSVHQGSQTGALRPYSWQILWIWLFEFPCTVSSKHYDPLSV